MAISGFFAFLRNRVLGNVIGFGAGAAAASAFEPALRPVAEALERQFANRKLTPAELAELVIRGARSPEQAGEEAAGWGLSSERFRELTLLAGNPPGPQELIELWRRGAIAEAEVDTGIRQGRFRTEWLEAFKAFRRVLLTPAGVAELTARGILSEGEGRERAAELGLEPDDFAALVEGTLRPPALGELLDLLNRGEVAEADVRSALTRAGVQERYHDPILELRRVLPPVSDLVRFAVREVYSPEIAARFGLEQDFPARFAQEAARVGLSEESARQYWAAHWDLPSPQMGFAMLHRGIISQSDLELLLRALDVMPFWRERLIELAHLVPGRIDLRRMFRAGVISRQEVFQGYVRLGYTDQDAERLTEFAEKEKLEPERDLTKAEVTSLYQARALDRGEATELLELLGYDGDESDLLLDLADFRRRRTYRTAAVSVVRARFLEREIDEAQATGLLDSIGLPAEEREELLDLWIFARDENPRRLTEAQARAAWRAGVHDEGWYRSYLALLGYPQAEADTLVALYAPGA